MFNVTRIKRIQRKTSTNKKAIHTNSESSHFVSPIKIMLSNNVIVVPIIKNKNRIRQLHTKMSHDSLINVRKEPHSKA